MENTFSIEKLPIWGILSSLSSKEMKIDNTFINEHINYFHSLEKELDKYSTDIVDMIKYEELEEHLCQHRQAINEAINIIKKNDDDISSIEKLKEIIDNLIKKTGKKKQLKIKKTFAIRLEILYESKGLKSREELENYLGVSQQTISSYFNPYNPTIPSIDKIIKLSEFFDCSCDYLINEKVEDTAIGYDTIAKETGLTSKSIGILQNINLKNNSSSKTIIKTINFLISKLYSNDDYETDILSALSEYFNDYFYYGNEFYNVTNKQIDILEENINEAQSLVEVKDILNSFKISAEQEEHSKKYSYADADNLHIINIQGKLVKLKNQLKQEHEDSYSYLSDIN